MGAKLPVPPTPESHPEPQSRASLIHRMLAEQLDDLGVADASRKALELMRSLQGTTLRIPVAAEIERMVVATHVVNELQRDPSDSRIDLLAGHHGTTRRHVTKTLLRTTGEGLATLRRRVANRCVSLYHSAVRRLRWRI